jgi:hypothetical protein
LLLEIDFDGAKYCWTGGYWVDQRFITVPALLAGRLARLVAENGLVLPPTSNEQGEAWPPRGSDTGGVLDYELSRDNHLLISANLSRAWRKYQHNCGAILQRWLSLAGVKSMLIKVRAFGAERPRSFQELVLHEAGVAVSFFGTRIRMDIPLLDLTGERFNPLLGWSRSKRGNAYVVRQFQIEGQRMELHLVITPPNRLPEPTYWDWHRRFWPGGRPGSSRRH